ncbi:MAG: ArdC family protein, partial [Oligoflexia bacterium]|nr:ArdC family protein [Oligoflexia bacterium]
MQKKSVYEIITSRVIKSLEQGVVPWKKPWSGESVPSNFVTKRAYSGLNLFLLNANSFCSRYYLTFLQVSELGGRIKKNEHATPIVFWKIFEKQNSGEEKNEIEKMP